MFMGEQFAGAPHAGLHLVDDEQDAARFGQCAQRLQEVDIGRDHPALALHRFEHHRNGLRADQGFDRSDIVIDRLRKAANLRREDRIPTGLAGCRHGSQRAAMKRVAKGDDLEGAIAVQLPPLAGQLDRALVGLGTGVGKEDAVEAGVGGEQAGQLDHRGVVEGRAGIEQLAGLRRQRRGNFRRAMAETIDRPALNEIEIALALMIGEP